MHYIPGSGRWSVTGTTPLSDGIVGDDRQGAAPQQITYGPDGNFWFTEFAGSAIDRIDATGARLGRYRNRLSRPHSNA